MDIGRITVPLLTVRSERRYFDIHSMMAQTPSFCKLPSIVEIERGEDVGMQREHIFSTAGQASPLTRLSSKQQLREQIVAKTILAERSRDNQRRKLCSHIRHRTCVHGFPNAVNSSILKYYKVAVRQKPRPKHDATEVLNYDFTKSAGRHRQDDPRP